MGLTGKSELLCLITMCSVILKGCKYWLSAMRGYKPVKLQIEAVIVMSEYSQDGG